MTRNIAQFLADRLQTPEQVLYMQFVQDAWHNFTAGEIAALAARWQRAYLDLGLEAGDRVAICARNGVNWVAADMAALGLRLVVVPLYVDDNAENVAWCIDHSGARLAVLENARLLAGLQKHLVTEPAVVLLQGDEGSGAPVAQSWLPAQGGDFAVGGTGPDTLATIIYTSGTTGRPKGVKLSHANIVSNVQGVMATGLGRPDDVFISLLPLSHSFERTAGYYFPLALGAQVGYCRSVNQLVEDLAAIRPTVMMAVPRVFERFLARLHQSLKGSPLKKAAFEAAVNAGWNAFHGRAGLVDRLLGARLRERAAAPLMERFGGRLRVAVIGGAALREHVARVFIGLGLPMLQGYGLTETSPVVAVNTMEDNVPESVGPPLQGIEVRLAESGELLVRGPCVMQGYWRNPEATTAVIEPDGWLHTGDLAEIRDGRIYIRGRAKEIVVLSSGEKFPTQDVEAAILGDETFEQVMLVGEGRACAILLAVSQEKDERDLLRRANARLTGFPRYVRVRRVVQLEEPWTVDNGLLTPTQKIKRAVVESRYASRIEHAFASLLS